MVPLTDKQEELIESQQTVLDAAFKKGAKNNLRAVRNERTPNYASYFPIAAITILLTGKLPGTEIWKPCRALDSE